MKEVVLIVAAIYIAVCAHAQLSGVITDAASGEKIPGAFIFIENSFLNTISDAEGRFSFDKLKGDKIKITVSHLSYENFSEVISPPSSSTNIQLKAKTFLADEVNIIATRVNDNSPTAFSNIGKQDLQKQNLGQDLPYLLNITLSAVVTSDAGTGVGYTGIRIRGSDATRVNFTINGIPVNDAEAHAIYLVDLPDFASSVDNIQIQRGVGTSTNGAGAFGGSVNMQSSRLSIEPFATVSSSYGSFKTLKNTLQFGTGLLKNKFAFEGRLSKITSDGYIDRATSDLKSFYLSGGYYGNKSSLRLIMFSGREKTYQAWYGVPQDSLVTNRTYNPAGEYYDANGNVHYYENQTDNYQQDYYQLLYSKEINRNWNINAALHYTKGKGYYEEYSPAQSFSDYGLENVVLGIDTITATDLIRQRWLDNDFYGFTFSTNYEKKNFQLTIGGAGNQYKGKHFGEVVWAQFASNSTNDFKYYDDDATKNDFNVFAKANYNLTSKINLFADLQSRMIDYSFIGLDNDANTIPENVKLNFFNPKAGITYNINSKHKVYASIAVGHKEPVRDDYTDSSPRSRPKPEEMQDAEVGYKFSGRKFSFASNFYYMNYKDQLVLTGKINDVGLYTRTNVDESFRRGMEVEAAYRFGKQLSLSGNMTLSENKIKNFQEFIDDYDNGVQLLNEHSNADIAFSPSMIAAGIISYSPLELLHIDFITKYVGKQFLDNTSDDARSLKAYLLNDIRINYSIKTKIFKELTLQLMVNNLFDHMYESNGYTYSYKYGGNLQTFNYYYPQSGRNFFGGIVCKF